MSFLPRRRIVAPIDFSERSLEAIEVALEIAGSEGTVFAVHVLPEIGPTDPGVVWHPVDDEARRRNAREALGKKLADPRFQPVRCEVRVGDAGHELAHFAQESGADLVVISSHGRTGFKRLLIGSVAERVVRLCHCPVLVLRH